MLPSHEHERAERQALNLIGSNVPNPGSDLDSEIGASPQSNRTTASMVVMLDHMPLSPDAANPDANLFDIEMAFRDAARAAYVIAGPSKAFHVITGGLPAMLAAVTAAESSQLEKRASASAGSLIRM